MNKSELYIFSTFMDLWEHAVHYADFKLSTSVVKLPKVIGFKLSTEGLFTNFKESGNVKIVIIIKCEGSIIMFENLRRCQSHLFTPNKPGQFTFPVVFQHGHSMWNNTAFSWGLVKSSPRVWIWKYRHFKRGARLHLDGFWVFIPYFKLSELEKDIFAKFNVNLYYGKSDEKIQYMDYCYIK